MKRYICRYCYEELVSRGEKVKIVDEYACVLDDDVTECDLCGEQDDLMEVELK